MTNNNGRDITYSSFNKPTKIKHGQKEVDFFYDANNKRYKKYSTSEGTTHYIGKSYERIFTGGAQKHKYFIYANGKLVSIFTNSAGNYGIKYLHYDNLGSIDTITDHEGVVKERFVYKPFGERINLDEAGALAATNSDTTNIGYTGHEHIEEFDFIHMNGRVYDPTIGRFMSADPHIQDSKDSQSYNRYTYVKNNPLKYTDPSGFFFKKLFKKIKKWIKPILAIAAGIFFAAWALYSVWGYISIGQAVTAGAWGAVMGSAAIGGFVSEAIMTGSLSGAVKGAFWAGVSAGVAYGIGHGGGEFLNSVRKAGNGIGRHIMHGISRAAINKLQGGRWSSGFWSGFASSALAPISNNFETFEAKVVSNAVMSGTVSEISGGKFANGAVTGAFVYMFNHAMGGNKNHSSTNINKNIAYMEKLRRLPLMDRMIVFYKLVKNGALWDYKQLKIDGYDDLGNFNYGATGAALGIPEEVLLRAAGWAQMRAGTSDPSFGVYYGSSPYGDDPLDQMFIKEGIKYYRSGNWK